MDPTPTPALRPTRRSTTSDLLVLGLGAMGSATVDAATRRGWRVIGLDAFRQGHAFGSSHGPTRLIRRSIEEGPAYVPLVLDALERWHELQHDVAVPLIRLNGVIRVAPAGSPLHAAFIASAVAHGLDFDRLSAAEIRHRYPGFVVPDDYEAMYESEAGILFADRAVFALQERAQRAGAQLHFGEPALSWGADGDGVVVRTAADEYHAARLVITAGAWTPRLTAELGLPLEAQRVVNVSFTPTQPTGYGHDDLPGFVVSDGLNGFYGVPAVEGEGLKVGTAGTSTDPDRVDRNVHADEVDRLRGFVDRFLPGASGPVCSVLTCLYTTAADGNFVIDRHPAHPNVVVASPCSGHGFKYTTAIGPLLVDLAFTGTTEFSIQRFAINRFAASGQRATEQ